jgi:plasmid stabilization system protein ParE
MTHLPLELHADAEDEYQDAIWWYRERNFPAAEQFVRAVQLGLEKIEESPERWPIYMAGFRKYKIYEFPYSIVYRIELSRVLVLAVAHGSRKPGYWKRRG